MGKQPLGRVLDPASLDAAKGPRALLRVEVPASWWKRGCEVELDVPARLTCARCEGGGCDGCGRSGAVRVTVADEARRVRLTLPCAAANDGAAVRLSQPFGEDVELDQLVVELRPGVQASVGLRCLEPPSRMRGGRGVSVVATLVTVALVAIVAALLAGR